MLEKAKWESIVDNYMWQLPVSGWEWRSSLVFAPDPEYGWKI